MVGNVVCVSPRSFQLLKAGLACLPGLQVLFFFQVVEMALCLMLHTGSRVYDV